MSKDKGIFEPAEGFAADKPSKSPFSVDETPNNPFAPEPESKSPFSESKSPFSVDDDKPGPLGQDSGDKGAGPFGGGGEKKSPFSYDPPVAGFGGSPFEGSPAPAGSQGDAGDPPAGGSSPFAMANEPAGSTPPDAPKGDNPFASEPAQPAAGSSEPPPLATAGAAAPVAASPGPLSSSVPSSAADPQPIRQLELRAIFGVDRELTENEMLDRSRRLSGIRQLSRISPEQLAAIENVGKSLESLGFSGVQVAITCANQPIEFIRDGKAVLAVQTDGSFAPGVRETLMIVARELAKM